MSNRLLDHRGQPVDFEALRRSSPEKYPSSSRIVRSSSTPAGVRVDADSMMQVATCWACVRYLSQNVAMLPWRLKRETGRGAEVQPYHPVDWMLYKRPSAEWSSFQFRETLLSWALRHGNGYAEIERSTAGRPIALWPIHPGRVRVVRDLETGELLYEIDAGLTYLPAADMFHLRGLGESPVGLSVAVYAAQTIGWVRAAQIFGASFFKQSANPSGVVMMKRPLSPAAMDELRKDFLRLYGGPSGANKTVFLDMDMDYKSISVEPEKGQFIQTNAFLISEICRFFGVPPHKIYDLTHATFTNIEHQDIEAVDDSLRPWVQRFQDEADTKLLGENRASFFSHIDLRVLLRADTATRMSYYQGLRNVGAINANEIRREEGLNGIGPDGEKYVMQSGMTTLNKIGQDLTLEPAPAPESAPAPEPSPAPAAILEIGRILEEIDRECTRKLD